ncbi:hypothetical protein LCGC14_1050690 [marine sediment metagenome]|uniref:YkgJ family cysteine cluster protein n=1 Tax=marine sediment metagenome TaxID=412755 RepID=A0A0F9NAQ5_9ZZZZ
MNMNPDKFISAMTDEFDCRRCGTCCAVWKIPVTDEDIIEEPLLAKKVEEGFMNKMSGNVISACPFYHVMNGCSIYETRPQACRDFVASPIKCMAAKINTTGLDVGKTIEDWKNKEIEEIVIVSNIYTMYIQILTKILGMKKRIVGGKTITDDLEDDFLLKTVKDRTLEEQYVG